MEMDVFQLEFNWEEAGYNSKREGQWHVARNCRVGNANAKALVRALDDHIGARNHSWCMPLSELWEEMEWSESTLRRAMRYLSKLNFLAYEAEGDKVRFWLSHENLKETILEPIEKPARKPRESQVECDPDSQVDNLQGQVDRGQCQLDRDQSQVDNCTTYRAPKSATLAPKERQEISPEFREIIDLWNRLPAFYAPKKIRGETPSSAVLKSGNRLVRDKELQECFADLEAVSSAIGRATLCHGKSWFTLPWLFCRHRQTQELNISRLLDGVYNGFVEQQKSYAGIQTWLEGKRDIA